MEIQEVMNYENIVINTICRAYPWHKLLVIFR